MNNAVKTGLAVIGPVALLALGYSAYYRLTYESRVQPIFTMHTQIQSAMPDTQAINIVRDNLTDRLKLACLPERLVIWTDIGMGNSVHYTVEFRDRKVYRAYIRGEDNPWERIPGAPFDKGMELPDSGWDAGGSAAAGLDPPVESKHCMCEVTA